MSQGIRKYRGKWHILEVSSPFTYYTDIQTGATRGALYGSENWKTLGMLLEIEEDIRFR